MVWCSAFYQILLEYLIKCCQHTANPILVFVLLAHHHHHSACKFQSLSCLVGQLFFKNLRLHRLAHSASRLQQASQPGGSCLRLASAVHCLQQKIDRLDRTLLVSCRVRCLVWTQCISGEALVHQLGFTRSLFSRLFGLFCAVKA